jgi:predicted  nucleic acid-binding Zn-ribbon protein
MKLPIPAITTTKPSVPLAPKVAPLVNHGEETNYNKTKPSDIPMQRGSMGPPPPPQPRGTAEKQQQRQNEPDWSRTQDSTNRTEVEKDEHTSRPNPAPHAQQREPPGQRSHANPQRRQQVPFRPGVPDKQKRKKDRGGPRLERLVDRPRIPLSKPSADNAVIVLDDDDPPPMKTEIEGEKSMEQTRDSITSIDDVMEGLDEIIPRRSFSRNSGKLAQAARIRTRSGSSHSNIRVRAPIHTSREHSVTSPPLDTEAPPESTEDIMNRTVSELSSRNRKLEKQVSGLETQLSDAISCNRKLENQLSEAETRRNAAEAKVRELTSSLQTQQKKMADLQTRVATFSKFLSGLGEDFTGLDRRNLELKHRFNELQSEKMRLQQDLEDRRARLREACDEVGKHTSLIQDLRSEVRRLSDNAKYADATINEKSSLLAEERDRTQLLESQILEERRASHKIAEKFDEMKLRFAEQLKEMKNSLMDLVQEGDSLKVDT